VTYGEQPQYTPDTFGSARLLVKDFDGTVAQTFEPSPSGINVEQASQQAIDVVFGASAVDEYVRDGGLRNRAPLEVVKALAPDATPTELRVLQTSFVNSKLGVLISDVGSEFEDGSTWPRPMPGYLDLQERIESARSEGALIDDLILSSGHKDFIDAVYASWGIPSPTHIIAEEAMRERGLGHRVKPSSVLMKVAHTVWADQYGVVFNRDIAADVRSRTVFVGDDPDKDGTLAKRSGVENFHLINKDNSVETWGKIALWLNLEELAEYETAEN